VIAELRLVRRVAPKLQMLDGMLEVYSHPPRGPADCTFARTTACISADLERRISPCQFGGNPDCANCGCVASANVDATARYRLFGAIPVGRIFGASLRVGDTIAHFRHTLTTRPEPAASIKA
jgi:hypothetical protein